MCRYVEVFVLVIAVVAEVVVEMVSDGGRGGGGGAVVWLEVVMVLMVAVVDRKREEVEREMKVNLEAVVFVVAVIKKANIFTQQHQRGARS